MTRRRDVLLAVVPADRREWVEAVWAESDQAPPGRSRWSWHLGGARVFGRAVVTSRRALLAAGIAALAAVALWAAGPGASYPAVTWVGRVEALAVVALLAALPVWARRWFGPAQAGALVRVLRVGAALALLTLVVCKARVEQFASAEPTSVQERPEYHVVTGTPFGTGAVTVVYVVFELAFLLLAVGGVAALFWATSERANVRTGTILCELVAGAAIGVVTYLVIPLGFGDDAAGQRRVLPGSTMPLLIAGDWLLLFVAPLAAAVVARRLYRGPETGAELASARARQALVAGGLSGLTGGLLCTTLGCVTIATMVQVHGLRDWLYPGPHSVAEAYGQQLTAASNAMGYWLVTFLFPVIGLGVSGFAGLGNPAGQPSARLAAPQA